MKYVIFYGLFVLFSINVIAQDSGTHVYLDNNTGWSLTVGLNLQPLNVDESSVDFRYVDESPSMDNIQSYFSLNSRKRSFGLNLGVEADLSNRLLAGLSLDLVRSSEASLFGVDLGIGYPMGKNNFFFIPRAALTLGTGSVKLGDINNNDVYIQVNDTKFYSQTVATRYKRGFLGGKFGAGIAVGVTPNVDLTLNAGYKLAIATSENLTFTGKDQEDQSQTELEPLSQNNIYLNINGVQSDINALSFMGIYGNVGVAIHFN